MASLPVEVLLGIYLGVLTGIVPGLIAWGLGFLFKYFTGVTIPGFGVVVLGLAIAGVNGGLLALTDPTLTATGERAFVAVIVVLMITLYAHSAGDRLGAEMPRKLSLRSLTDRTLSADVVELVGGRGEVRVTISGDVGDLEGYPPVPADLRREMREGSWTFPADLPLAELETRLAERLRSEYDLVDVSARIDERGRATVSAAPPIGGLSKRVPAGKRAVSFETLVPTGLARGDEVTVHVDDRRYDGTVVSLRSGKRPAEPEPTPEAEADEAQPPVATEPTTAPTATGGSGRLTVAFPRADAEALVGATPDRVLVRSRGRRREFELVSLLRRAGSRFRRLSVRSGGALDGATLGEAEVRDVYSVAVLAVRHDGRWVLGPRGGQSLSAGDELYAVGTREALSAFEEAVA